jgi:hypothetical protein
MRTKTTLDAYFAASAIPDPSRVPTRIVAATPIGNGKDM